MSHSALNAIQQIVKSEDRALAYQFFLFFSRFEYALKRAGFVQANSRGEAYADWECFAHKMAGLLRTHTDDYFKTAVAYIQSHPPKKQVLLGERLTWDKDNFSDAFDLDRLLVLVRRIRNNLFHGGKFPEGQEDDVSRDRELLKSGIAVLQACLESDPRLMTSFLQGLI